MAYDYLKLTLARSSDSDQTFAAWSSFSPGVFYYDRIYGNFYKTRNSSTGALSDPITALESIPQCAGWRLDKIVWPNTDDEIIGLDGTLLPALKTQCDARPDTSAGVTLMYSGLLQVTRIAYVVTLNATNDSGSTVSTSIFWRADGGGFFADEECTAPITSVARPRRKNYVFKNYTRSGAEYIDADGNIGQSLYSMMQTSPQDVTLTAQWDSLKKLTVYANGSGGENEYYYYSSARLKWYADEYADEELEKRGDYYYVTPMRRAQYRLDGYTNTSTGSTVRIEADGKIVYTPTGTASAYARWTKILYKLTIDAQGGTGGTSALYYGMPGAGDGVAGVWFADAYGEDELYGAGESAAILPAAKSGYFFRGVFAGTDGGGTKYANADGTLTAAFASFAIANDTTKIYCAWGILYALALRDADDGDAIHGHLYYEAVSGTWYADAYGLEEWDAASGVDVPARQSFAFIGYFDESGSVQYFDAAGMPTASFAAISADSDVFARWSRISYRVELDFRGGYAGAGVLYTKAAWDAKLYADEECTERVEAVEIPQRPGYDFAGYADSLAWDGVTVIDSTGALVSPAPLYEQDCVLYALWTAKTYTLTFNAAGGTSPESSMEVTFDAPVGELPVPARQGHGLAGWFIDGAEISAESVWTWTEGKTAVAQWEPDFGGVTDYFGLKSAALVPFDSDAGDFTQRTVAAHRGKYERDGNTGNAIADQSGVWRNPTVKYMVVEDTVVVVRLGKGFAGMGRARSGYMIVSVDIDTAAGSFPVVTVTGAANEGANAVNNFQVNPNKFDVAVFVAARARAQNLMDAIAGAPDMRRLTLRAVCDAVVPTEKGMPCASDIVNGRYELSADVISPQRLAPPDMAAAGGFVRIAAPQAASGTDYMRYSITARKEML